MRNLVSYKLYEAASWLDEKIGDYDFDLSFVKDICQDLIDEGMSVTIKPHFLNKKFDTISKKIDALQANYYCGYSIYISNMRFPSDVTGFIESHNLIFNTLRQLQSNFECKVTYYGGSIHVYCLDLSLPFNTKTIDGKKFQKLKMMNSNAIELVAKNLERQSKILRLRTLSDDMIEVTPIIDIDKVEEILHKIFQKLKNISVYQSGDKIIIKII